MTRGNRAACEFLKTPSNRSTLEGDRMNWKPLNDAGSLATESADVALADWLARSGGDGFGLPLVGALLGLQSPQETALDVPSAYELSHSEG